MILEKLEKQLYRAIMFANKLIEEDNKTLEEAVKISSKYYKVEEDDVKYYLEYHFER